MFPDVMSCNEDGKWIDAIYYVFAFYSVLHEKYCGESLNEYKIRTKMNVIDFTHIMEEIRTYHRDIAQDQDIKEIEIALVEAIKQSVQQEVGSLLGVFNMGLSEIQREIERIRVILDEGVIEILKA